MKTIILDANGQLGCDLVKAFQARCDEVVVLTHQDLEVSNDRALDYMCETLKSG